MADTNAIIDETAETSQYDENAKALLAEKAILSRILVYAAEDFKGMDPNEVEKWIEGEPSIGRTPVDPGFTNEKPEGNRKEMLNDMCNLGQGIMEQAMKKGIEQGIEQGMEQGVQLMGELFVRLQKEGKTEELSRVLADAQYRNELLISYGLLQEK